MQESQPGDNVREKQEPQSGLPEADASEGKRSSIENAPEQG
jgi:hypothetical protein